MVVRLNDEFFDDDNRTSMGKADGVNSALKIYMLNMTGTEHMGNQVNNPVADDAAASSKQGGCPVQHNGAKKIEVVKVAVIRAFSGDLELAKQIAK
ncbi:hypothetical protein PR003_g3822 [Phytophthora rubi]|uniref:Uncharacterized protein n=3 Tax=Phytophthora TaxID=4783 RepID=A0A6A4G632_9STRA|nr:hypothetical protein PR001_g15073 [Phytophthora rubi]KAE9353542.1 hypothetical protein PR003_g3822 [Phytophthora rubi]